MIAFGRYGNYGGKICHFTHRNPKNGEVWSDDIPAKIKYVDGKKIVVEWGKWVASDKVQWLDVAKKGN